MSQLIANTNDFRNALQEGEYAWPGGYQKYFLCDDGDTLSFAAAFENIETIEHSIDEDIYDGWRIVAVDINWEDEDMYCAHTGERIPSAYGD